MTKITPIITLETITPEIAARWMEKNIKNRPQRQLVINRYTEAMKDGQWTLNAETIKFDTGGNLLDGQHRLQAIINSGVSIRCYVARDLAPEVFDTIDVGAARAPRDTLALAGETNFTVLSQVLRMWYIHEELGSFAELSSNVSSLITTRDLLQTLERHPDIRISISAVTGQKLLRPLISAPQAAFCHYLFARIDLPTCNHFFQKFTYGDNLESNHPVLLLRQRLLNLTAHSTNIRIEKVALVIKAWNLVRKKKTAMALRWQVGQGEDFPKAI